MKKLAAFGSMLLLLFALTACGSEEKAEPKKEKEAVASEPVTKAETMTEDEKKASTKTAEEGGFIKYRGAKWEGSLDNGGLAFKINGVSVTNDAQAAYNVPEWDANLKTVGIWLEVSNTTQDKQYKAFPDQATLVTSTGEQVEAQGHLATELGGEIYEGVHKEGDLIFVLDKTEDVADITWVKLVFNTFINGESDLQEVEVKLTLK